MISLTENNSLELAAMLWITFPEEQHSSKQGNILILKTILFILQNMFQSIYTSSSLVKSIIKFVDFVNLHVS